LLYPIRLGVYSTRLQIQDFLNAGTIKNVVTAPDPHLKSEPLQQLAQAVEWNIRISGAEENFLQ
jgi:hypothetical protein